jgi:hypothetical protein
MRKHDVISINRYYFNFKLAIFAPSTNDFNFNHAISPDTPAAEAVDANPQSVDPITLSGPNNPTKFKMR